MVSYKLPSSLTTVSRPYAVFLSFRGEDTRTGFTSYLYNALTSKHIRTYIDDKSLQPGSFIATELLAAIEASTFAIVVLSSDFATSKWCLEEIAKIVDCEKRGILTIIPIFYHVDPSDVRHQRNSFKDAFTKHEDDPTIVPQNVKRWRDALAKVGEIAGVHITQHRKEVEFVTEIVRNIQQALDATLPTAVTDGLVGIESRVKEVKRILLMESSDVHFIGLCGMSGVGKTTLAEVVYGAIQKEFQGSSFIENIKDVSKQSDCSSLCKLQQKLLDDILKDETVRVQNVIHGQTLLMTKLRDIKVLIVLDDVNHADQLRYLAGGLEWFGNGSRVIVTTTNMDLLNVHKVNEIYECEEMNNDEALRLFIQSAFEHGPPTHVYEKWSDDIVKLAGGLPLALTVYGSLLYGKEENYWKEMLKKLREYPPEDVLGRLEVVFARLDSYQQEIFMYIACFLKGRDMDLVKDILTNIGLYAECGITDLKNKFLITINLDDCVWMHDLLQQMCWEILRKKSHIRGHKAIKDFEDIEPKEARKIKIINQEKFEAGDGIDDPSFLSDMTKLKFLRIRNIHFPQGLSYLSNDLRILEWFECSLKSLPSNFKPTHMYKLEVCYSQLKTLWEETLVFPNLRSIDLSFSKELIKIPDLTSTPKLVKLILEGCTKLKELHESVLLHKSLQYMNLMGCTHLQCLGRSKFEMEALVTLLLSGCSNLEDLPEFGQNMKRLENLYLDGTNIKKLPESLGELHNLRKLDASETSIEEIPLSIRYLKRLRLLRAQRCPLSSQNQGFLFTNVDILSNIRELDLSYCNLSVAPDGIGLLHRLISLDLSGNDFVHLPASISLLSNLRMLFLNNCKRLQSVPKLSIVNEDTLYGLPIRFNYIMSGEEVNVSKFHAASNNTNPTISCLNCPNLAKSGSGCYLAENILHGYLQLRTKCWMTPVAVFEIVGTGSELPSEFVLPGIDDLILKSPWIGVAICAVIAVDNINAFMEDKYVITAHIRVGEKHWRISVPINFFVAGLESQVVIYWTVADDLDRILDSRRQYNLHVSFSVEPEDGNLQVTKFGVRIICEEDLQQLKVYEESTSEAVNFLFQDTFVGVNDMGLLTSSTKVFFQHYDTCGSLGGIQNRIQCLLEMNQKVLNEYKEALEHGRLLPLAYDFYQINHVFSKLYNDFVMLLTDISGSWLSVKLAMEQIVVKSRAENYTYEEMRQLFDDLEAAESVRFSDKFVTSFAYICKQTVAFLGNINKENELNEMVELRQALATVSGVMIVGIFSMVAAFTGDSKLLHEMKEMEEMEDIRLTTTTTTTNPILPERGMGEVKSYPYPRINPGVERLLPTRPPASAGVRVRKKRKESGRQTTSTGRYKSNRQTSKRAHEDIRLTSFNILLGGQLMKAGYKRELKIQEIIDNAILLEELKKKYPRPTFATWIEEMITTIENLERNVNYLSGVIDNMSRHAQTYSHFIGNLGTALGHFSGYGNLLVPRFGAFFESDQHILQLKLYEDPMNEVLAQFYGSLMGQLGIVMGGRLGFYQYEVVSNLFRATQFLPPDFFWLLHQEALIFTEEPFLFGGGAVNVLSHIRGIFIDILGINLEFFKKFSIQGEEWLYHLVIDYYEICLGTSKLYDDFVKLLKNICGSWLSVKLALQQVIVETEAHEYTFEENTLQRLNDPDATESLRATYYFAASFASMCKQIVAFLKQFNQELETRETIGGKGLTRFIKVSNITVIRVLGAMAAYMGNSKFRQKMNDLTSKSMWLELNKRELRLPRERDAMMKRSIDRELRIRDFYGNILVEELKNETPLSLVTNLERKINEFSKIIRTMSSRAQEYRHGIMEARSTLFEGNNTTNKTAPKKVNRLSYQSYITYCGQFG